MCKKVTVNSKTYVKEHAFASEHEDPVTCADHPEPMLSPNKTDEPC